jgi:hypothetical protein
MMGFCVYERIELRYMVLLVYKYFNSSLYREYFVICQLARH